MAAKHDQPGQGNVRGVTLLAIGADGWPIAERLVRDVSALSVETAADALRATVRGETGWSPAIIVLDDHGLDITVLYDVN